MWRLFKIAMIIIPIARQLLKLRRTLKGNDAKRV